MTSEPYTTTSFDYSDIVFPCDHKEARDLHSDIIVYVNSIICVLGLLGNTLVIVTYAFYKKPKSMTDVYLLNVAIADILFVIALPLIIYNEQYQWHMGKWACKLLRGIYSINLYSGMLLLACISTDRYIAIVQARRSFRLRSTTLVYSHIICAAVWMVAITVSTPTFIYYDKYDIHVGDGDDIPVCENRFDSNDTAVLMKTLMPSMQISIGFFFPLLIMVFCYSSIIVTLLQAKNFQRHKAVRVVMAVVVVFIVCHLPYNIMLLIHTVVKFKTDQQCDTEIERSKITTVLQCLAYFHCCLNPLLYAFIGVKFRNHFRKIMQDLWCLGKRYISVRRTSRFTSEVFISRKSSEVSNAENASSFTM
ncbi:C-C chemokine receptor type 6 [Lepisosteus oculatus]|uniref:Chemokine (C-C motif) receptor 6a n=1 Tax=Lepisosteus oculatus TaxID=7918 RepID=W5NMX1_LEPOC|nr:PREDICTED: C-C chemokine receptor type 6 [Lepisosteus oculatus]XP_015213164.1 PREDICTED: C-C chemokine receptor type 6 [Lepisosteus oculatus]